MRKNAVALIAGMAIGIGAMSALAMCTPPAEEPAAPSAPPATSAPSTTPGPEYAPRPADDQPATGPVIEYDDGVLFCGVGAGVATDIDPFGNSWAYCEPGMVE